MKKRMLARIKVEKARRMGKRARHHPAPKPRDPKDLRGAKGTLLKDAAERALRDDLEGDQTGTRHHPVRIAMDW